MILDFIPNDSFKIQSAIDAYASTYTLYNEERKGRKQLSHFRMPILLNFHIMLKSYILLYHTLQNQ